MFAGAMVIVVAALLSFAATLLKPMQDRNVELEKKQNILNSIGINVSRDEAEKAYSKYIKQEPVVFNNEIEEGMRAFAIDLSKEIKKEPAERYAPLYIAEKEGNNYYILPLRGKGLWGPIWGYIALEGDINTIYGATFDHKTETPGLGAEIATSVFMDQFHGKRVLDSSGRFVSIEVKKGQASNDYEVDGISGGTITSVGVQNMLDDCIKVYIPFLKEYANSTSTTRKELIIEN